MLTTIVDHNDIRLQPINRVTRKADFQVSDGKPTDLAVPYKQGVSLAASPEASN